MSNFNTEVHLYLEAKYSDSLFLNVAGFFLF